ncbi:MAG: hypothetical protein LKM32_04465 [Chiayiivirga sp.]|jgi:hypothetical protein|uniref:hypothetical protein n=1 Tax=Chiayiivirga sp. TaxID=2041042 RepID=UPI0025BBE8C4|nr:hypothetical protein [Chiayiivirga sp.]MCI1728668.1 hypothetical protein [Chiayiivirga sp.]
MSDGDTNVVPFPARARDQAIGDDPHDDLERKVVTVLDDALSDLEDDLIDDSDREAIDSEEAFIHRFGFDAPRHRRRWVIDLKHRADLTDRELRLLRGTGSLMFDTRTAAIFAPWLVAAWGWIMIAVLGALMLGVFLIANRVETPTLAQISALAGFETALLALCFGIHRLHVQPRAILRRVRRRNRDEHSSCRVRGQC